MTEFKDTHAPAGALSPVQQKFILHWGEMGTRWGVNRTVAQVHALLYISPRPLHADDIIDTLDVARSNVSTSLKELQGWGIVRLVHVLGDKRDHFESMKDVWEMFRVVMDERKKREFNPTMRMLHACIAEAAKDKVTDKFTEQRLRELYGFFETTSALYRASPPLADCVAVEAHEDRRQAFENPGTRRLRRIVQPKTPNLWPSGLIPVGVFPLMALAARSLMPRWGFMWAMAFALYAGCKWLTYREARARGVTSGRLRTLGYLLAWPGMDAPAFLSSTERPARPRASEWMRATLKTLFGAALVWGVARTAMPLNPLLAGWIGMAGLMFVLHFGTFHVLSLLWRTAGVNARPVMQNPLRSYSLAQFWGRRWNTAFHEVAARFTFRPLRPRVGPAGAALLVFLISGLIHELVISLPARGGYGLPTGYFILQGLGVAGERTRLAHRLGLGHGWPGRLFTLFVASAPAFWLFPPVFVRHVILPMLGFIGAA